jgi:hypothetical protein
VQLTGAALLAGACLVVAPLDDVNTTSVGGNPDSAAGSGGDVGSGGSGGSGASGASGGTGAQDAAECSTNQQCITANGNEPFRCLEGRCVALRTAECPVVLGRFDHANAFFIGAFASFRPNLIGEDDMTWNYELAINEFNADQVGGLPGPNGQRPLAAVVCDGGTPTDGSDRRARVRTGAAHLTETLRVQAVIAALESGDLLETFDLYGAQKGVFFLTPGPATRAMLSVAGQNLLWHMLGLPADLAPTYEALLTELEAHVKALRALTSVKVALITTDEAADADLENAADDLLRFNGQNLEANRGQGLFIDLVLPATSTAQRVEEAAQTVLAFHPDIVVSMAGPLFSTRITNAFPQGGVIRQVEAGWRGGAPPYYILSPSNYRDVESSIFSMIDVITQVTRETDMHKRFVGVNVAGSEDGTLYNDYLRRLRGHERNALAGQENFYDAIYFAAYAIHAAGPKETIFGSDLDFGIGRLITGGREFRVGPDDILATFEELGKREPEGRIRLVGTLGPPRFNGAFGVRVDTGAVYCFERPLPTSDLVLHPQVGYYDRDIPQPRLQVSRLFANKTLPCLQELGLPQP